MSVTNETNQPVSSAPPSVFSTTHWSVVLSARDENSPDFSASLEALCRAYWYPLYAYVRRRGHSPHDAQDLTQEFFSVLLRKNYLQAAGPEKGRFRTFLLVAFQRFLANEWDRLRALKRGGGQTPLPLDADIAEQHYLSEPDSQGSADRIYERRWALTLLDRSMTALRAEYAGAGKQAEFEKLKGFLTMDGAPPAYAELASQLGTNEGAARVAVHRLRKRYRDLFRAEIARTLTASEEIETEVRHLLAALAT